MTKSKNVRMSKQAIENIANELNSTMASATMEVISTKVSSSYGPKTAQAIMTCIGNARIGNKPVVGPNALKTIDAFLKSAKTEAPVVVDFTGKNPIKKAMKWLADRELSHGVVIKDCNDQYNIGIMTGDVEVGNLASMTKTEKALLVGHIESLNTIDFTSDVKVVIYKKETLEPKAGAAGVTHVTNVYAKNLTVKAEGRNGKKIIEKELPLNEKEVAVLIACAKSALDCSGGDFAMGDEVVGYLPEMNKHSVCGYISMLDRKNVIMVFKDRVNDKKWITQICFTDRAKKYLTGYNVAYSFTVNEEKQEITNKKSA